MRTVRIIIIANPGIIRDGYQALFEAIPGLRSLEPADDIESTLERIAEEKPELVVIDASEEAADYLRLNSRIKSQKLSSRYIVIYSKDSQLPDINRWNASAVVQEGTPPSHLSAVVKRLAKEIREEQGDENS